MEIGFLSAHAEKTLFARKSNFGLLAVYFILLLNGHVAYAEDLSWPLNWGDWQAASGDWGGYRTQLSNAGIDTKLNYTHDIMANPVGGERQSAAYAGAIIGAVDVDLEKMVGLNGISFGIGFYQGLGRDLSGEDINNVFDVAQISIADVFGLSQMNLVQTFLDDRLEIAIGRLSTGSDFASNDAFPLYVNSGVNGNPLQLQVNLPSFTTSTFSQWGVRGTVRPQPFYYVSAGAYNADPSAQVELNFQFDPENGVLTIAEGGVLIGQEKDSAYLPGHFSLGGYYDTSDYTPFDDSTETIDGNWGLYVIANQMVYEEQEGQGLNIWGLFTLAPRQSVNTFPYGVNGGAYYKGLLTGRDDDITAGALYLGYFSEDLPGQTYELVFEVNHRFQLAPWAYWTADFQYVLNPNGQRDISDTWVVGTEFAINF